MSDAFCRGGLGGPTTPWDADTQGRGPILLAQTQPRSGAQGWFLDRAISQRVGAGVWRSAVPLLGGEPGSGACCDLAAEPDGQRGLLVDPALGGVSQL